MDTVVIGGLLAIGCAGAALWQAEALRDQTILEAQLARLQSRQRLESVTRDGPAQASGGGRLARALRRWPRLARFEAMMWQAGVRRPAQLVTVMPPLAAVAGIVAGVAMRNFMIALAAGGATLTAPVLYISWRAKRRTVEFIRQLPYALEFMQAALEAGHTPLRSLQAVAEEFSDPLGSEFRMLVEQAQLGMPLAGAFARLLERVAAPDLRLLATAIRVQNESGSSLAEVIGRLSGVVRARQRFASQIRAMTTQSRASAFIVAGLPLALLAVFALIQPAYVRVLFVDPIGVKALKFAIALDALAFVTIRRMLRAEY